MKNNRGTYCFNIRRDVSITLKIKFCSIYVPAIDQDPAENQVRKFIDRKRLKISLFLFTSSNINTQ